jgi:hypothetical protein
VADRWFRVGAIVEWLAAAGAVALAVWTVSGPVQRAVGRGMQTVIAEVDINENVPPGVPAGAMLVPVMLLLDGQEVRLGDLHTRLESVLPPRFADGPPVVSSTQAGERHTRAYTINSTRVYIVCERSEPGSPMRVSGIFLP